MLWRIFLLHYHPITDAASRNASQTRIERRLSVAERTLNDKVMAVSNGSTPAHQPHQSHRSSTLLSYLPALRMPAVNFQASNDAIQRWLSWQSQARGPCPCSNNRMRPNDDRLST